MNEKAINVRYNLALDLFQFSTLLLPPQGILHPKRIQEILANKSTTFTLRLHFSIFDLWFECNGLIFHNLFLPRDMPYVRDLGLCNLQPIPFSKVMKS